MERTRTLREGDCGMKRACTLIGLAGTLVMVCSSATNAQTSGAINRGDVQYYVNGTAAIFGNISGYDVLVGRNNQSDGTIVSGGNLTIQTGAVTASCKMPISPK